MTDTIDLVPGDTDAVEVTVRLPRAAARAAADHNLMPLAELLARAASPSDEHALLLWATDAADDQEQTTWVAAVLRGLGSMEGVRIRHAPTTALLQAHRSLAGQRESAYAVAKLLRAYINNQPYLLVPVEDEAPADDECAVLDGNEQVQDETDYLMESSENAARLLASRQSVAAGKLLVRELDEGAA
ncbi:hypothetical protein [Streptomyces sp. IMTB 1903]|uniref:hypothetical protein n=1 Tax=Streptomyces sp. IMTB 1903 TaxID=1776680 RepID=UPI00131D47DB|nr:hypothetical protein [Streptomyces sp. IMTB 1903]